MKGLLRRAAKHTTVPVRLELCEPRLLLFAGQLDLAFGDLGTASRSLAAPIVAHATALARQPDGKILLAGDDAGLGPAPLVARHLPDGRLDPTFAQAGRLDLAFERTFNSGDFTTGQPKAILVQKSGRIVLVTESTNNLVILALRPDGTPDTTFGSQGRAALFNTDYNDSTPIHSAILLPDQSILVGASLEHYKTTGDPARPLQLTSSAAAYLHVFADGTIDPEYDGHFRTIDLPAGVTQASIERLAPLKSGGALAVGRAGDDLLLAKITPSGHVARTFGDARGFTLTDFGQPAETARALLPLDDGSVVVSGDSAGDIVLARYAADGRLLPTFGAGGKIRIDLGATETATDLLTTSDGRLLVVGNSADNPIVVSLLRRRGRLDRAYANAGVARITFTTDPTGPNTASAATLLPGDSLLLAGTASGTAESVPASRLALARLRPDGSTDRAFAATPTAFRRGVDFRGTKVARQSDGKLVTFSTYDQAQTVAVFMRFLPDGRPDTTFAAGGVLSVPVKPGFSYAPPAQLRIDSKGRLLGLIVSNQTCPNGPRESIVLRVTPTGTLDDSFADAGLLHPGFVASALAVTDGHLLLAGGRAAAFVLRRFDHAGRPDPSFGNAGEAAVTISREPDTAATPTDLLVAPDGAIVAVGGLAFGTSNFFYSASRFAVARFTARGTPDATFGDAGAVTVSTRAQQGWAHAAAFAPDGRLVVVGTNNFSLYSPPHIPVARLTSAGALDTTFADAGLLTTAFIGSDYSRPGAVAVRPDGKILIVGSSELRAGDQTLAAAMRLTAVAGALDTSYGDHGVAVPPSDFLLPDGALVDADGAVTVAGIHYEPTAHGADAVALTRFLGDQSPAITARVQSNILKIQGTPSADRILLHRHADGLEVASLPGRFDPATFSRIEIASLAGDDRIDASAASLPVFIDAGDGSDVLLGGSGPDSLLGGNGDDTLFGGQSADTLRGGDGNDYLNPGPGPDQAFGDAGNDQLFTADTTPDHLTGGPGFDRATTDRRDLLDQLELAVAHA